MKAVSRTSSRRLAAAKPSSFLSRSASTSATSKPVVVGIRREDPGRIWERRCPITPDAVNELVRDGVQVMIQPCERRVWNNDEFVKAGAVLHPTLAPAEILVGIKETPLKELDNLLSDVNGRERTHLMFSHTAKGQLYNMPLLSKFLDIPESGNSKLPRLIDYELMTNKDTGKRVIGFGWFAGAAGVVEGLSASALDYLAIGVSSPFLYLPRPYSHPTLEDMRQSLRAVGGIIATQGMPPSTGPYVIAVTGNGNVSTGALDLLSELPTVLVKAENLPALVADPATDLRKVYIVHVSPSDYLSKKDGSAYNRSEYYATPEEFESHFHEKIGPYVSLLINGAGWQRSFPRLLSTSQLQDTVNRARAVGRGRFRTIADISCDVGGGIEFLTKMSTIDDPFFYTDGQTTSRTVGDGRVQVMSVDILPSELPSSASTHFSQALKPYLQALINDYGGQVKSEDAVFADVLNRATIAQGGKLTAKHEWLQGLLASNSVLHSSQSGIPGSTMSPPGCEAEASGCAVTEAPSQGTTPPTKTGILRKQRVLLLGSGMVAKPAVDEFLKRKGLSLVIASNNLAEAEQLTKGKDGARAVQLDVMDRKQVETLVEESDVVVSLLPASLHTFVADVCIQNKKHLVTASYISPAMRDLDERAKSAGVLLLNEIGLDPGIDHCSAMDMRTRIEAEGRKIVSFVSWCGGLPAPENSDVPLGMKFSWSPKGLLSAALNDAQFKLGGKNYSVKGSDLLSSHFKSVPLFNGLALEGLANRNSFPYAETYQLGSPDSMHNLFRGTLRYQGFSRILDVFRQVGLLSPEEIVLDSRQGGWSSLVNGSLRRMLQVQGTADTWDMLKSVVGKEKAQETWPILEELGMVSHHQSSTSLDLPSLPTSPMNTLDLLTTLLSHKLRYTAGERDMVILSHQVISVPKHLAKPDNSAFDTSSAQTHTSTLVSYGTPSSATSAMSQTVGLPLAFAALQVLDGAVHERGVRGPCDTGKEVWGSVLEGLEMVGLGMKETVTQGAPRSKWWK